MPIYGQRQLMKLPHRLIETARLNRTVCGLTGSPVKIATSGPPAAEADLRALAL
jgi:hypothetical protein